MSDITIMSKTTRTAEQSEIIIQILIPEDSSEFKSLVDIACCYNAETSYSDGIFSVKIYSDAAHNMLFDEYYNYLFNKK